MRDRTTRTKRPVVRRKLVVGPANDHFEREADQVAKRVVTEMTNAPSSGADPHTVARQSIEDEELMTKRVHPSVTPDSSSVARQSIEDEELMTKRVHRSISSDHTGRPRRMTVGAEGGELDSSTTAAIDSARTGGRPLEGGLRRSVERAFGADFSNVRMHTGATSDRLNAQLGARAFTTGADVFVRSSDYRPDSHAGRELLAHELTHVVQQGAAPKLDVS